MSVRKKIPPDLSLLHQESKLQICVIIGGDTKKPKIVQKAVFPIVLVNGI